VLLHDDPITHFDFVVGVLQKVFRLSGVDALRITREAQSTDGARPRDDARGGRASTAHQVRAMARPARLPAERHAGSGGLRVVARIPPRMSAGKERLLARLLAVAAGLVVALGATVVVLWQRAKPSEERPVTVADVLREPALADELLERMARDNKGEFDTHPDADLGHVNLKGTYERSFGKVEINTYGSCASARYALPKPPGTVRVVLLGDSFVWGWELPAEQRMGVHLERALLERRQRQDLSRPRCCTSASRAGT
jgi:hypothetical protein